MGTRENGSMHGLTPEGIQKLERLKAELEALNRALQNTASMSSDAIEALRRGFRDKEAEVNQFLTDIGVKI